eukprot:CFRG8087T1
MSGPATVSVDGSTVSNNNCRYYAMGGMCFYGDQCNFVHAGAPATNPATNSAGGGTGGTISRGANGGAGTDTTKYKHLTQLHQPPSLTDNVHITPTSSLTPSTSNLTQSVPTPSIPSSSRKPCRNIALHGYCKFQDKGCVFNHDQSSPSQQSQGMTTPVLGSTVSTNHASTPVSQPGAAHSLSTIFSPQNSWKPSQTPSNASTSVKSSPSSSAYQSFNKTVFYNTAPTSIADHSPQQPLLLPQVSPQLAAAASHAHSNNVAQLTQATEAMSVEDPSASGHQAETYGGTMYFYPENQRAAQEAPNPSHNRPTYKMYAGPPSYTQNMRGDQAVAASFFMNENIRSKLSLRNALTLEALSPSDPLAAVVPQEVDNYHTLYPLDVPKFERKMFGYPTYCFKAIGALDGLCYCLRQVKGFRLTSDKAMSVVDPWTKIGHSNIVGLKEVYTTRDFGDHSLVFVYDYFANSTTLRATYFENAKNELMQESVLWSYVIQLTSALRVIHASGMACRVIEPSKILLTGRNRIRINCVGIFDVLNFESIQQQQQSTSHLQQEDLAALGRLVLALACGSLVAVQQENLTRAFEHVTTHYSSDLKNLIVYLLSTQQPLHRPKSVNDLMPMIGARFYTELENEQTYTDILETELSRELENGRLFRLISKLGFVNERPEYNMDPSWAETGDRYLLKLFRDYVFHQVTETGEPSVSLAHVVQCLNKLDAGSSERVCLMSRDEQSILVVSYKDLKRCAQAAFDDLRSKT